MRVKHLTSTQELQGVPWPQQPGYNCVCISSHTYLCAEVRAGKAVPAPMSHPTAKLGDLQRVLLHPGSGLICWGSCQLSHQPCCGTCRAAGQPTFTARQQEAGEIRKKKKKARQMPRESGFRGASLYRAMGAAPRCQICLDPSGLAALSVPLISASRTPSSPDPGAGMHAGDGASAKSVAGRGEKKETTVRTTHRGKI